MNQYADALMQWLSTSTMLSTLICVVMTRSLRKCLIPQYVYIQTHSNSIFLILYTFISKDPFDWCIQKDFVTYNRPFMILASTLGMTLGTTLSTTLGNA